MLQTKFKESFKKFSVILNLEKNHNFLVGLSGKTINGVHGARYVLHHPKTLKK
jgi:hypothetical protein